MLGPQDPAERPPGAPGTTGPSREASRSSWDHRTQQRGLQELLGPQDPAERPPGAPPDLDKMENPLMFFSSVDGVR